MKKAIGYLLIASPFMAIIAYGWYSNSFASVIIALAITVCIVTVIWVGVKLAFE